MKHSPMTRCLAAIAVIGATALISPQASAVILWNYLTTDGSTTLSGQLTTDGELGDLAAAREFNVQQVNSLLLNGVPVSFTLDLPTADVAGSSFNWNGTVSIAPVFIVGLGDDFRFEIDINLDPDAPSVKAEVQSPVAEENIFIVPGETSFTPVRDVSPVPESSDYGWAFGAGLLVINWRRRLRATKGA